MKNSVSGTWTGSRLARGGRFYAALFAATALLSVLPLTTPQAARDERSLSLYNTHTREKLTVVFKRDGAYVADGLKQLNHILRDWRLDKETTMDPKLFDVIWDVVRETGASEPIHIICGYRAPDTNEFLRRRSSGVAKNSQHVNGKAMDFFIPGVPLAKLREVGLRLQAGGVGFYPSSGSPFVHLDTGTVRHWPSMNRDQLARVFPNGHTLHVPSDGKPLPGYAEALAEYRSKGSVATTMVASRNVEDEDARPAARSSRMAAIPAPKPAPESRTTVADSGLNAPIPRPAPDRLRGRVGTERAPVTVAAVDVKPAETRIETRAADTRVVADSRPAVAATVTSETTASTKVNSDRIPVPVMAFASATGGERFDPLKILRSPEKSTQTAARTPDIVPAPAPERTVIAPWTDPLARLGRVATIGQSIPFWNGEASVRQGRFGALTTTQARFLTAFMVKPQVTYGASFSDTAYPGLRTDRFTGSFVRQIAVIDLRTPTNLASR